MGNVRSWVFRVMVLAGAAMILISWFQPWWTAYIVELKVTAIDIYAYGIASYIPVKYAARIAVYHKVLPAGARKSVV